MSEIEDAARRLRKKGCEYVPEGTIRSADNRAGFQAAVSSRLEQLWRAGDPPSEKLLTLHRQARTSA